MTVWRSVFIGLLSASLFIAWQVLPNLQIDTDLADVSPTTRSSAQVRNAIKTLRNDIQQRVIFLIQARDEDLAFDAGDAFRADLVGLTGITVSQDSEQLAERLIQELSAYRFSLLSADQRTIIDTQSSAEIALQAQQNLYRNTGGGQLLSFMEDPLGWHNETFLTLLRSSRTSLIDNKSTDRFNTVVALKINEGALNVQTQEVLSKHFTATIQGLEHAYDVNVYRSGVFFFAAEAAQNAKRDISLISLVSSIGVVLLLLLAFATLRALILPALSISLGVGFAFLMTHLIYGKVHVLTIVFGASLIGVVIDYSLHYFYHHSVQGRTLNSSQALHRALLLSLTTSLIGYAALSFSDLAALQKVAVFSCCGLIMAWLSVICLGEFTKLKPNSVSTRLFPALVKFLSTILAWASPRIWFTIATALVISATLVIKTTAIFSDDPRIFFTASPELMSSERQVAAVANDYEPGRYFLVHGQTNSQVYARYQQLSKAVNATPQFKPGDFSSLMAWVPDAQQQRQDYLRQGKLYQPEGAAALMAAAMAIPVDSIKEIQNEYQQAKNRWLSPSTVSTLLGDALPPFWISNKDKNGKTNIVAIVLIQKGVDTDSLAGVAQVIPGVEYINTLLRTQTALSEQRKSASKLLVIAYLLIGILLVVRYRSLFALWLLVVPVCASASFILISTLAGVSINLFHTMALFLVLGFGMDYAIFIKEMSQQSSHQFNLTLNAILLSALTSMLSFGLLSTSSIPVVSSFGLTLLVGNVFNLLGVFVASQILFANKP